MSDDRSKDSEAMPTAADLSEALRILEQAGAVRRTDGGWVHEAQTGAQEQAENLLASRIGHQRARRLIKLALEQTSVETPPKPK